MKTDAMKRDRWLVVILVAFGLSIPCVVLWAFGAIDSGVLATAVYIVCLISGVAVNLNEHKH